MQDSLSVTKSSLSQSEENQETSLSIDTIDGFAFISSSNPVSIETNDGYQKKRPKINDYNYVPLKGPNRRPLSLLRSDNCPKDRKYLPNAAHFQRNHLSLPKMGNHMGKGQSMLTQKQSIGPKNTLRFSRNLNSDYTGQVSTKDVILEPNRQATVVPCRSYSEAKGAGHGNDENQLGVVMKKLGDFINRQLHINCFEQTLQKLSSSSELSPPRLPLFQPLSLVSRSQSKSHSSPLLPILQPLDSNANTADDPDDLYEWFEKLAKEEPDRRQKGFHSHGYVDLPIIRKTSIPWITNDHLEAIYYDCALNAERIQSIRTRTVSWKDPVLTKEQLETNLPIERLSW